MQYIARSFSTLGISDRGAVPTDGRGSGRARQLLSSLPGGVADGTRHGRYAGGKTAGTGTASLYLAEPQCQALIRAAKAIVDASGMPAAAASDPSDAILQLGRLGEYEILEKLGEGEWEPFTKPGRSTWTGSWP